MRTFYFNTGVKPWNSNGLNKGEKWSENNEKLKPFDCKDVPEKAVFLYMCDNPDLENNIDWIIVREVFNTTMLSRYAYFRIPKQH